jgi:hypothetical protein
VDSSWLVRLYEDVGLSPDQAARAAEETRQRLLRRERPRVAADGSRRSITDFLVRDPLVSLNRIIGRGDSGLPFYDEESNQLSSVAFGSLLADIGLDPVVAIAFAKVVVEAYEPKDLYTPIWEALGQNGPLDLDRLRLLDWTPLRSDIPLPQEGDTIVTRAESASSDTVLTPTTPMSAPPTRPTAQSATIRRAQRPQGKPPIVKPKK